MKITDRVFRVNVGTSHEGYANLITKEKINGGSFLLFLTPKHVVLGKDFTDKPFTQKTAAAIRLQRGKQSLSVEFFIPAGGITDATIAFVCLKKKANKKTAKILEISDKIPPLNFCPPTKALEFMDINSAGQDPKDLPDKNYDLFPVKPIRRQDTFKGKAENNPIATEDKDEMERYFNGKSGLPILDDQGRFCGMFYGSRKKYLSFLYADHLDLPFSFLPCVGKFTEILDILEQVSKQLKGLDLLDSLKRKLTVIDDDIRENYTNPSLAVTEQDPNARKRALAQRRDEGIRDTQTSLRRRLFTSPEKPTFDEIVLMIQKSSDLGNDFKDDTTTDALAITDWIKTGRLDSEEFDGILTSFSNLGMNVTIEKARLKKELSSLDDIRKSTQPTLGLLRPYPQLQH